jgi:hypothetical protein
MGSKKRRASMFGRRCGTQNTRSKDVAAGSGRPSCRCLSLLHFSVLASLFSLRRDGVTPFRSMPMKVVVGATWAFRGSLFYFLTLCGGPLLRGAK